MSYWKSSEKDDHEKEEEEAERNVRKSPKKKPPRRDKERRNIKKDDPDVDNDPDTEEDKDLSMNYKDIGGSMVDRVLERFLKKADEESSDESGESGDSEKSQEDNSDDEKSEEGDNEEKSDENNEEDKEKEEKGGEEGDNKNEDENEEPEPPSEEDIDEAAKELASKSSAELQGMLTSDEYSEAEKDAVREALSLKTDPLPPDWDEEEYFENGMITLKGRRRFRSHMENWDAKDFADNLNYFKERLLNHSLTEGKDQGRHYYEALIELVKKKRKKFEEEELEAIDSVDEVLGDLDNPEEEFDSESGEELKEEAKKWRQRVRRTSLEKTEKLLKEVKSSMNEEGKGGSLSVRYAWLSKLRSILEGFIAMKKESSLDKSRIASSIKSGFDKASQYRGLPGPLDDSDPNKPPQPKWEKVDPHDLNVRDYARLVREAMRYLDKPIIENDLLEYDPSMARRIALDYAIHTLDGGKYDKAVDAPTYNSLLKILNKKTSEGQ